ncbi:uncharacterized protein LOC115719513 [Cannabis sativa]|uniref:uncharacterized protein LOC115719513 n=1 Tax=Cannabis sativa TaxID=3483 RepID=UPI0029CA0584|nr:uncharacterized protein LOC115719513 [Cannabis sativa]
MGLGGDQAYPYKGHSNYGGGHHDYENDSNQLCRTVIYDNDGRKRTVVGCSPYDADAYVVETEITEHILSASPMIATSDYRYGSPNKLEPIRTNYGSYGGDHDSYRKPSSPYGHDKGHGRHYPQEIDRFLTGVQIEASRPSPHRYSTPSNGIANIRPSPTIAPHSIGGGRYNKKDHDYGHHKTSGYGNYSSDDDDEDDDYEREEDYYKPGRTIQHVPIKHNIYDHNSGHGRKATIGGGGYGTPIVGSTNYNPTTHYGHASSGSLSMPTNSIEEAIDYLKSSSISSDNSHAVKPYGHGHNPLPKTSGHHYTAEAAGSPYGTTINKHTAAPVGSIYTRGSTVASSHGAVMDCYEAARRFNGKVVRT